MNENTKISKRELINSINIAKLGILLGLIYMLYRFFTNSYSYFKLEDIFVIKALLLDIAIPLIFMIPFFLLFFIEKFKKVLSWIAILYLIIIILAILYTRVVSIKYNYILFIGSIIFTAIISLLFLIFSQKSRTFKLYFPPFIVLSFSFLFNLYSMVENRANSAILDRSEAILKTFDINQTLKEKIVVFGNPKSNIVLINTQGGPILELENLRLIELIAKEALIDINKILLVNVHQCQTFKNGFYTHHKITFKEAKECDIKTVDTLAKVVKYFKKQNKKVYVLGISFGAFVVEDLLARYKNIANRYIIEVGRLDMDPKIWKTFSQGHYANFVYNKDKKSKVVFDPTNEKLPISAKNMAKIAAGLGYKRYTKLLKNKKLDNVIYVYGTLDEQVGRLTKEEIEFLKDKNVTLYNMKGGHSQTIDEFSKRYLKSLIY